MLNPKVDKLEFKTGDILIARGTAVVSSIIARLGDEEGDFSHLAIVSEDVHGKKYVVESLIQTGTIIGCALFEGAAFANIFAYMQDAELVHLAVSGLALLCILAHFPIASRIEQRIEEQLQTQRDEQQFKV